MALYLSRDGFGAARSREGFGGGPREGHKEKGGPLWNSLSSHLQPAAMAGWNRDWEEQVNAIIRYGLPVFVRGVELLPSHDGYRLIVISLDACETLLPRSHAQRGFDLHISLLFEEEVSGALEEALRRLQLRWAQRHHVLDIAWVGSGGAAFLRDSDTLAADPDLRRLRAAGWYADRETHVSL